MIYSLMIESSSSDNDDIVDLMIVRHLISYKNKFIEKIPCRISMLSGKVYIFEVLVGNLSWCYEEFSYETTCI